ncbi:hypothetical protein QBC34DRAFT_332929 [Podospora aff. communis PSN243]|uniref:C2H2-type domain-containing protein n=1 Tax=Podospora aff. communis PSN243 TaxID=3040156 RepID=A0AAV9GD18_9PEZI|nr:hypothetical protein QBC34DRAFT_332929 [Podospora aff. communis PSN243]
MDILRHLPWICGKPRRTRVRAAPRSGSRPHVKSDTATMAETSKSKTKSKSKSTKKTEPITTIKPRAKTPAPGFSLTSEKSLAQQNQEQAAALEELIYRKREVDALKQAKRDKKLTSSAPSRWNPTIDPSSKEFAARVASFREVLTATDGRAGSLNEVLTRVFSPHERSLLIPADRERNSVLADIQKRNAKSYSALVRSDRFKKWMKQGGDQLAFKLAMLWYGLPVAPLRLNYWRGWPAYKDAASDDETDTEEWMKGDETEPEVGRLRFLNGYHGRMYEWDGVRDADPALEAYFAFQRIREKGNNDPVVLGGPPETSSNVGLRGGGLPEDEPDGDFPTTPLRGGGRVAKEITVAPDESSAEGSDPNDENYQYDWAEAHGLHPLTPDLGHTLRAALTHGEFEVDKLRSPFSGTGSKWAPLYGWQGIVWFPVDSLFGFVDAVDRLLGLDNRAGVSYKLYLVDRKDNYPRWSDAETKVVCCNGVGDFGSDLEGLEWLRDELFAASPYEPGQDGEETWPFEKAVFITTVGDSAYERPPKNGAIEPPLDSNIQRLSLHWTHAPELNRPDVAYLRMPEKAPHHYWYTNFFGVLIERACRVLAGGRIAKRPARPPVPDVFIGLEGRYGISYGGLSFANWKELYAAWKTDKNGIVTLTARTPQGARDEDFGAPSDRFNIYIPGAVNEKPIYLLHSEVTKKAVVKSRILEAVQEAVEGGSEEDGDEDVKRLSAIEMFVGIDFLGTNNDGVTLTVVSSSGQTPTLSVRSVEGAMTFFKGLLDLVSSRTASGAKKSDSGPNAFPQFIVLRPVFESYTLFHKKAGGKGASFDPKSMTINDFRDLVRKTAPKSAIEAAGKRKRAAERNPSIVIRQTKAKGYAAYKPSFLVDSFTTEQDWKEIRKRIVMPNIVFELSNADDFVYGILKPGPEGRETFPPAWGYRDIYETSPATLYAGLARSSYPDPNIQLERHMDFQLIDAEGAPGLQTLQPWETQRQVPRPLPKKVPRKSPKKAATTARSKKPSLPGDAPEPTVLNARTWSARPPYKLSAMEKAARLRERAFAHPLSIYDNKNIPIQAPPIESLIRVPGSSMPTISIGVSTPSEVRRLQKQYHLLRNVNLLRTLTCPHTDCPFTYPINHPQLVQAHLRDAHTIVGCNFCDEPLYAHWPDEQRRQHFIQKHATELLTHIHTAKKDGAVSLPNTKPRVDQSIESKFHFCSRCGRDHTVLNAPADRAQHDTVCYPGRVFPISQRWTACEACGTHLHINDPPHHCEQSLLISQAAFCKKCAMPLTPFSEGYRDKHLLFCKGRGRQEYKHCPWDGGLLSDYLPDAKGHVNACAKRPVGSKLPTDPWENQVEVDEDENFEMSIGGYLGPSSTGKRKSAGAAGAQAKKRASASAK